MPHVSKHSLSTTTKNKIDEHIIAFLTETGRKERKYIFRELLTQTERIMIGKRLILLLFINRGLPTHKISKILKMSPSTIARYKNLSERGFYSNTKRWLKKEKVKNVLIRLIGQLLITPFEAHHKSLKQILDEM